MHRRRTVVSMCRSVYILYSTVCSRRFSLASIRVHCRVGAPNNYPVCCLHRDFLRQWHVAVDMVDCHDPTTHLVVSINIQKNKTLWRNPGTCSGRNPGKIIKYLPACSCLYNCQSGLGIRSFSLCSFAQHRSYNIHIIEQL